MIEVKLLLTYIRRGADQVERAERPARPGADKPAGLRVLTTETRDTTMELTTVWFILIAVLWIGYFCLEGFDFGVGMLLPVLAQATTPSGAS